MITTTIIDYAFHYDNYKLMLENLLKQGKTTGPIQNEEYLNFAKINLQRMHRLEKTTVLTKELKQALALIKSNYVWLVLTEGWCGDAAQSLPVFHLIEQETSAISLKLILRDEHLDIMDQYLTHGSRSIPKLICLEKESLKEVFHWGPRPAAIQELVMRLKQENVSKTEKGLMVQNWYNADKTLSIQNEFLNLVRNL